MAGALALNQWSYLAVVYDGSTVRYFVNGALQSEQPFTAAITARGNPINIGADITPGQFFKGLLDDVRIYNRALTQLQIQTDMVTPSGAPAPNDPNPPQVFINSPGNNTQVHDIIVVTADASDDAAVAGVHFLIDGVLVGVEDTIDSPFGFTWDTRTVSNGAHTLTALARDVNGNATVSAPVTVNVSNTNYFQNQILATGFDLPTTMAFLPDGTMLVGELGGTVSRVAPPFLETDPTPFLQISAVGRNAVEQGLYDIAVDPNFATNHYIYVTYTLASPDHDRL